MEVAVFVASQIVGFFAFSFYIATYWQKNRKVLLLLSIVICVLFGIQYYLLGSITGLIINLIGILRSISFIYKGKNKFMSGYAIPLIVHSLYILNGVFTWGGWITIFPTVASILNCHTMWQNDTKTIRRLGLPILSMWLIYVIYLNSYVSTFFTQV